MCGSFVFNLLLFFPNLSSVTIVWSYTTHKSKSSLQPSGVDSLTICYLKRIAIHIIAGALEDKSVSGVFNGKSPNFAHKVYSYKVKAGLRF